MNDNLDKALREKLHDHRIAPPEGLWEAIQRDLPAARPRRRLWPVVVGWTATACMIAGAVFTGHRLINRNIDPLPQTVQLTVAEPLVETPAEQSIMPDMTPLTKPIAEFVSKVAARVAQPNLQAVATALPQPQQSEQTPVEQATTPTAQQHDKPATDNSAAPTARTKPSYATSQSTTSERNYYNPMKRKSSSHNRLSGSLYAANFGGGRGSDNGGSLPNGGGYTLYESVSRGSERVMVSKSPPPTTNVNHRLPLSVGAEISMEILPRLSIETGVTYTYLRSDYKADGLMSEYSIEQRLHYVGIPISVSYNFARTSSLDFYVRGGGMLEKGVYGARSTKVSKQSIAEVTYVKMNGVQPSISAAAGIELMLGRTTGIYFEPGFSYYPDNENQPESYRTQHPVTFNLKGGVRFSLSRN